MTEDPFFKENPKYANLSQRNQSMAKSWSEVGTDYNGVCYSSANGFRAHIALEYPLKNGRIDVLTVCQLQSGANYFWPRIAELTEQTFITIECSFQPIKIRMDKKQFSTDCWAYLFDANHYNEHDWVKGANTTFQQALVQLPLFKKLLAEKKLYYLSTKPNKRQIKLEYTKVFESEESIRELLDYIIVLTSMFERYSKSP